LTEIEEMTKNFNNNYFYFYFYYGSENGVRK